MGILNNAIDSIALGLEDFELGDHKRLISCTRNLFAGILLLFKYKLSILSPNGSDEVLIKQRILPQVDPNGQISWFGDGKKTVDVQQIKERFVSLGIKTHWDRIKKINDFRNDIEHYHSSLSKDGIRELISNSFIIIRDFISDELALDPKSTLGYGSWDTLVSVAEVYDKEKFVCNEEIDKVDWESDSLSQALKEFKCPICRSNLMTVKESNKNRTDCVFICKSCDAEFEFEKIVEEVISDYLSIDNYLSYKDGSRLSLVDCPECGKGTYVYFEGKCVYCGITVEHSCRRCEIDIPAEEFDGSGVCSWCSHMMNKDA